MLSATAWELGVLADSYFFAGAGSFFGARKFHLAGLDFLVCLSRRFEVFTPRQLWPWQASLGSGLLILGGLCWSCVLSISWVCGAFVGSVSGVLGSSLCVLVGLTKLVVEALLDVHDRFGARRLFCGWTRLTSLCGLWWAHDVRRWCAESCSLAPVRRLCQMTDDLSRWWLRGFWSVGSLRLPSGQVVCSNLGLCFHGRGQLGWSWLVVRSCLTCFAGCFVRIR
jgi:hypothetical protein